jgi:hypothetical protein
MCMCVCVLRLVGWLIDWFLVVRVVLSHLAYSFLSLSLSRARWLLEIFRVLFPFQLDRYASVSVRRSTLGSMYSVGTHSLVPT